MGQLALGLRSLLVKLVVFFLLAALLAWALGGTLWPRAEVVELDRVSFDQRQWFWQLTVGGRHEGRMRWQLMVGGAEAAPRPVDGRQWARVAGPVAAGGGLYYAGRATLAPDERWHIVRLDRDGTVRGPWAVPDRLAVEQQLARVSGGLELQDAETIARQRPLVLDPARPKAEE